MFMMPGLIKMYENAFNMVGRPKSPDKADEYFNSTIKFFYLDKTGICGSRHTGRRPIFQ